jgi:hypothetical protein
MDGGKTENGNISVLAFFSVVAISQISPPRPDKGSKFQVGDKKKQRINAAFL